MQRYLKYGVAEVADALNELKSEPQVRAQWPWPKLPSYLLGNKSE